GGWSAWGLFVNATHSQILSQAWQWVSGYSRSAEAATEGQGKVLAIAAFHVLTGPTHLDIQPHPRGRPSSRRSERCVKPGSEDGSCAIRGHVPRPGPPRSAGRSRRAGPPEIVVLVCRWPRGRPGNGKKHADSQSADPQTARREAQAQQGARADQL